MMIQAVLSNPNHPEYGVATIPFPIPRGQYAHCMELLEALEIGDAVKAAARSRLPAASLPWRIWKSSSLWAQTVWAPPVRSSC